MWGDARGNQVASDANRLVQVLGNLLNNAARKRPQGEPIMLAVARLATTVTLRSRDGGIDVDGAASRACSTCSFI